MLLPPKSVFPAASGRVAVLALSRTRGEVPFGKKEPRAIPVPTGLPESFPVKKLPVSIMRTELWFGPCPLIARLACISLVAGEFDWFGIAPVPLKRAKGTVAGAAR